jgi:PAS domain-containing protein
MNQEIPKKGDIVHAILDVMPSPIFVVDDEVRIYWFNMAALPLLQEEPELVIRKRGGDILHCLHALESMEGCGRAEVCQDCPIRDSVKKAINGQRVVRQKGKMKLVGKDQVSDIYLLVTSAPFDYQDNSYVLLILEDISELTELKTILPICVYCKKVRDDEEFWQSVENYFKVHLDLDFSHGVCPECAKKVFPGLYK